MKSYKDNSNWYIIEEKKGNCLKKNFCEYFKEASGIR